MIDIIENQLKNLKMSGDITTLRNWSEIEDMTCRQAAIMLLVQDNPGLTVGAIAEALECTKPSVTRSIDKLVGLGILTRHTSIEDRRLVSIYPGKNRL